MKNKKVILLTALTITLLSLALLISQATSTFNAGTTTQTDQTTFNNGYNTNTGYSTTGSSTNIQYTDPRYQTTYNSGFGTYNNQYSYTNGYSSNYYGNQNLGIPGLNNFGFSNQVCQQGQSLLVAIVPGSCTPAVVRSDLLEEQNVPVFCKLTSLQTNPLLGGLTVRSVRVSGQLPAGIQGVTYYPSRAAITNQGLFGSGLNGGLLNTATQSSTSLLSTNDLGYLVIVVSRGNNESSMPEFVEGNITAVIDYSSTGLLGMGTTSLYLDTMTEEQWQNNYKENSFWNGQAYARATAVDDNSATISIYRDHQIIQQTVTLTKGQSSSVVPLGGNLCSAGMVLKLEDLTVPRESALIQINGQQQWVAKGDRIINNRCTVQNIVKNGLGGKLTLSCPGSTFDLDLIGGKATLEIDGVPSSISINQNVKGNIYLGYLGKDNNGNPLAVLIGDSNSNTENAFADKEIFKTIDNVKDKTSDTQIKSAIETQYNKKVQNSNVNIIILRLGTTSNEGIRLLDLFTLENQQNFNNNPLAQTYYDRSINYYRELYDLYPQEQSGGEEPYAAKGLQEAFELSRQFQMNSQAQKFSQKLSADYPDSYLSEYATTESNYLFKYDRSNAKKTVQVDNGQYSIDLLEFKKPSRLDASASFIIDGREETLGIGELTTSSSTRVQLLELNSDRATIGYDYNNQNGNRVSNKETLIFNSKDQTSINGVNIRLTNINLKKQAKITISPNTLGAGSRSTVNFPVRIGIEKRAIELSPEKTKDLMNDLEESIKQWNDANEKLGKVIQVMKAACFTTSAVLTVKNLFESASGAAVARNRLMTSSGGWNDKCEDLVNQKQYISIQQCLLDNNDKIENDIKIFSGQIQSTNDQLKQIQENVGINKENPFDFQGQTDAKEVEKQFEEQFKSFCEGKQGSIDLPGQNGNPVSYSEICDWKGMTHEQRREILTLTKIKDQGGSEVLQDYTKRELGRITLDAKNTNEIRISNIISEENTKKYNLDLQPINPVGDTTTLGDIKTITDSDKQSNQLYSRFDKGENVIRVTVPRTTQIGDNIKDNTGIGGKEYLVSVEEIQKTGGVYKPIKKIVAVDGTTISDADQESILNYLSSAKLDRIKQSDTNALKNQMTDLSNLQVKYFDQQPFKGLPSIVPFDIKEGWYVKTSYVLAGFGEPYDDSGRVANYYICNVGDNGLIEFKKSSDDICRYYNGVNSELSFPGLSPTESANLVRRAQAAIQDASRQFGQENININGQSFKSGTSFDTTEGQCTDFMSAQDCNILFNVCDPVICPSSRCDLGGDYRVDNVIQTGVIGSLALCLPNAQEGIAIPICLTGVHAGIDGYVSILNSTVSCLNESLETGQNIGICDEIKSVYMCDFFWRQAAPFTQVLFQKTFEIAAGQGARGGGEYLTVENAWSNTQGAVNYFTGQYAGNSFQAFYNRNLGTATTGSYYAGDVGGDICKSFISTGVSGTFGNLFDSLTSPDSPEQYTGWFSEFPQSTATVPAISHYKVYYHLYAGKDLGASYQVYLKGSPQTQGIINTNFYMVDQGYISRGSEVDRARDFTAVAGFQQLCININGREDCGFKQVSTSFALNTLADQYAAEQSSQTNIVSEQTCISGSPSLYSILQPNVQAGVEQTINPQLYNQGITRICATENPGKQILSSGEYDTTASTYDRWKEVGYCDDPTIKCWLDTSSVKNVIKNSATENEVLGDVNLNALGGSNFIIPEIADSTLSEARNIINSLPQVITISDDQQTIDGKITNIVNRLETLSQTGPNNIYRAHSLYLLGNMHKVIAGILFQPAKIEGFPISDTGTTTTPNTETTSTENQGTQLEIPSDNALEPNAIITIIGYDEISFRYDGSKWVTNENNFDTTQGYSRGVQEIIKIAKSTENNYRIRVTKNGITKTFDVDENLQREIFTSLKK